MKSGNVNLGVNSILDLETHFSLKPDRVISRNTKFKIDSQSIVIMKLSSYYTLYNDHALKHIQFEYNVLNPLYYQLNRTNLTFRFDT